MTEEEAQDETLAILNEKSISIDLIKKFGIQAPVNPKSFDNVNKQHVICISEELIEDLFEIHKATNQTGKEIPFFLFGEERADGSVFFNQIVTGTGTNTENADFSQIAPDLEKFMSYVLNNKLDNQVVCHGHTHGRGGKYADNFSLYDMSSYVMMNNLLPLMQKGTIQTVGCVFNGSGDLNFVLYDMYNNGFYKFPNVMIEYNDGSKEDLPAYSRGNYNISNSR